MNTKSASTAASRTIPPMSYPRRIRAAAHLAWKTMRTGQHLEAVALLDGARAGMDVGINLAVGEIAKYGQAGAR